MSDARNTNPEELRQQLRAFPGGEEIALLVRDCPPHVSLPDTSVVRAFVDGLADELPADDPRLQELGVLKGHLGLNN